MLKRTLLAGAFALSGAMSANAATITLFDDTFDADSAGVVGFQTVTELANWNVLQGNVDILGTGFACTGCIDLDGTSSPAPAVLETKTSFTFLVGVLYTFNLFFAGGTEAEQILATVNGSGAGTTVGPGLNSPFIFSLGFGIGVQAPLRLELFAQPNNLGPYLDRVLITFEGDLPAPVPLPAAAPLLLAGLGALGLAARRRRRT